jgi:Fic family protein
LSYPDEIGYIGHMREERALRALEESIHARAGTISLAEAPEALKLRLRLEEIWGSCVLAGSAVTLSQTRALLQQGVVAGDRAFRDYLTVWGYGRAAAWVQSQRPRASGALITIAEIRQLHARATEGLALVDSSATPGAWRTHNARPVRSGVVPVPPSLIVSEVAGLVDRSGHGPPASAPRFLWLAMFQERLERIRPFSTGNGRVARLAVNVLLARMGLPCATIAPRSIRTYRAALSAADAGDYYPLALFTARSVQRNLERFAAPPDLLPLSELAGPVSLEALHKAAQRGRLRHAHLGSRLYSTTAWRDEYLLRARQRIKSHG